MLISMNWINDFVDLSGLDLEKLIHQFTLSTAEVEDIYYMGRDIKDVVVARIVSIENHPDSKKLHLLKVDAGDKVYDCVCGCLLYTSHAVHRRQNTDRSRRGDWHLAGTGLTLGKRRDEPH